MLLGYTLGNPTWPNQEAHMLSESEIQLVTKYILSLDERSDHYGEELVEHVLHRVSYLNYDDGIDWDTYRAICSFRDEFEDEAEED